MVCDIVNNLIDVINHLRTFLPGKIYGFVSLIAEAGHPEIGHGLELGVRGV